MMIHRSVILSTCGFVSVLLPLRWFTLGLRRKQQRFPFYTAIVGFPWDRDVSDNAFRESVRYLRGKPNLLRRNRVHHFHSWTEQTMTTFLRTQEVSDRTGIPVSTLRWWRHISTGPPSFSMGKRTVVYPVAELEHWIERRQKLTGRGETE
jgi:prophage regulatory protein